MVMRAQGLLKIGGEERIIAEETTGLSRQQMLLYPQKEIPEEMAALLKKRLAELKEGRPLQYILGYWEFEGRRFEVGEGVLIPREDTSALVALAKEALNGKPNAVFADLGSGSGIIAATLSLDHNIRGYAVEKSEKAFEYLSKNIKNLGAQVTAINGDMFSTETLESLPLLDLVASNPPYITADEMKELDQNVLKEPHDALFGGSDGLDFYREICKVYYSKIKEGGALAFEVGFKQADDVAELMKAAGFKNTKEQKDINGIRRAVCAFK
jgi:release factor glutamine methyltransferase